MRLVGEDSAGSSPTRAAPTLPGYACTTYSPSAGANRVYIALSTLRDLGLKEAIASREDGYLLDPACSIVIAPEGC